MSHEANGFPAIDMDCLFHVMEELVAEGGGSQKLQRLLDCFQPKFPDSQVNILSIGKDHLVSVASTDRSNGANVVLLTDTLRESLNSIHNPNDLLIFDDLAKFNTSHGWQSLLQADVQSGWLAPVFVSDRLAGLVAVFQANQEPPTATDRLASQQLARISGILFQRYSFESESQVAPLRSTAVRGVSNSDDAATELGVDAASRLEHFDRIAHNMPGFTYRCLIQEDNNSKIVYVSEQVRELFGIEPREMLGDYQKVKKLVHPDDWPAIQRQAKLSVLSGGPFSVEFRLMVPGRGPCWVQNIAEVAKTNSGEPVWDGIVINIDDFKRAQFDLDQSNQKLHRIIENFPGMIFRYVESEDGSSKIVDVSPNIRKLYEIEPSAALTDVNQMWARTHPDDVERLQHEILSSKQSLTPFIQEFRLRMPGGKIKWTQMYSRPFLMENGDTIWDGVALDITDLKLTQFALAESKSIFLRTSQNIPGVIFQYARNADGNEAFTYVSNQVQEIFRVDPELVIEDAKHIWRRLHPDDLTSIRQAIDESAANLKPFEHEFRAISPSSSPEWIQVTARPHQQDDGTLVWDGVAIDISDRKRTERALQDSQQQFRRMTENIPGVIYRYIVDSSGNEKVTYISNRVRDMYEVEPADVLKDPNLLWNRVHQDDVPLLADVFSKGAQQLVPIKTQYRLLLPRKGLCWIESTAFPHRTDDGSVVWDGVKFDITKRKQAEMQWQLTNEELRRATRLKDEFVANMSHELRTPLNAILGMAEGLQESIYGQINDRQLSALETIERSGTHLLELINEILDLAKIEAGQGELQQSLVHIDALCKSSLTFVETQAKKKDIHLSLEVDVELPPIHVDERKIRQVLINLLNNAVKFTPNGGDVTLKATSIPPCDMRSERYLRLSVSDTGCGIASKDLKTLFQPFVQVVSKEYPTKTGTGLGLALVKSIVEMHDGFVTANSEVGVGSNFVVELPYRKLGLLDGRKSLARGTERLLAGVSDSKLDSPLVLIAEDNEANVNSVSSYLRAKGFRVEVAGDGLSAIEKAKDNPPHVVLMDIQMPGMSGLMAIEKLRQLPDFFDKPIIALTALAMDDDRQRCISAGANEYLSKPVKLKQLLSTIESLLDN